MDDESCGVEDLLRACHSQPGSGALLRALIAEARRPADIETVTRFLSELAPQIIRDEPVRAAVADFLREAGCDDIAERWSNPPAENGRPGDSPTVIDFTTRRPSPLAEVRQDSQAKLTFAEVAGLEEVKRQIHRRMIAPRERPGLFRKFQRRSGGGLLLYGPPGCGKTMLARATAGEAGAAFIPVEITSILDRYHGDSEKHLVAAFAEARYRRPAVLFFDEIEALAARRSGGQEYRSSLVSTFLNAFDGLREDADGVLVLGATNVPWSVDSAFRRPGRFDRVLFVPPPDAATRTAILELLLHQRPIAAGLDLRRVAAATSGFSGADLLNLVETAIDLAIEESLSGTEPEALSRRHLEAALREVKPTTLEWLATARNYAKYANDAGLYDEVLAFLNRNSR